MKKYKRDTGTN